MGRGLLTAVLWFFCVSSGAWLSASFGADDVWFADQVSVIAPGMNSSISVSGPDYVTRRVESRDRPGSYGIEFVSVPPGSPVKIGVVYSTSKIWYEKARKSAPTVKSATPVASKVPALQSSLGAKDVWFADQVSVIAPGMNTSISVSGPEYVTRRVESRDRPGSYGIEFVSVPPGSLAKIGVVYSASKIWYDKAKKSAAEAKPVVETTAPVEQKLPDEAKPPIEANPPIKANPIVEVAPEAPNLSFHSMVLHHISVSAREIADRLKPAKCEAPAIRVVVKKGEVGSPINPQAPPPADLLEMKYPPKDPSWTFAAANKFIRTANFDGPLHIVTREEWGALPPQAPLEPLGPVTGIVIHHAESALNYDMKSLEKYHREGLKDPTVAYQYVIAMNPKTGDWDVFEGCPPGKKGAHVPSNNTGHIGICILGSYGPAGAMARGYQKDSHESERQPMKGADLRLGQLIQKLKKENPGIQQIMGHADGDHGLVRTVHQDGSMEPQKMCPGPGCRHVVDAMRERFNLKEEATSFWLHEYIKKNRPGRYQLHRESEYNGVTQ